MKHHTKFLITRYSPSMCLLFLLFFNCKMQEPQTEVLLLGSNLDSRGFITNSSLNFIFPPYTKNGKNRDFFNYLYFSGDTLCFTITLKQKYRREQLNVQYVNPRNGLCINAERIDIYGKTVSGFCLVGSIMEHFYISDLDESLQLQKFSNTQIPIAIVFEAFNNQTGCIRIKKFSSYRISFHK